MASGDDNKPHGQPNWFDKINYIVQFLIDPCDAPVTMYIQTLKPALLDFLVDYYQPDVSNIMTNLFRWSYRIPRLRSRRKGRPGYKPGKPGKGSFVRKIASFDIDEFISQKIQLFRRTPARKVSMAFGSLIILEGIIERVNFWLFVFELALQFFYKWSSLLKNSRYCQAQGDDILLAKGPDQVLTGIFGYVGLSMPTIEKIRGRVTWDVSSGTFNGQNGVCVCSCDLETGSSFVGHNIKLRMTVRNLFHSPRVYETTTNLDKNSSGSITVTTVLGHADMVTIEHACLTGLVTFKKPVVSIHGANPDKDESDS